MIIDCHVHICAMSPGHGSMSPKLLNSLPFRFMRWRLGLKGTDEQTERDLEAKLLETIMVEYEPLPGSALGELTATFDIRLGQTAVDTGLNTTAAGTQGNVNFARLVGEDANTFGTPEANLVGLKDNEVNLTPDPTCAASGASGELSIIDIDESSADVWMACNGTNPSVAMQFLGTRVTHSTNQAITDETNTAVAFDTESFDTYTLHDEFCRDRATREDIFLPVNYYPDDDPEKAPRNCWRAYAHLLFGNWINEMYQTTPYELARIGAASQAQAA